MRERDFRDWFEKQGYAGNTIQTQLSSARLIEQAYGDLDRLYEADGLNSMLAEFAYSAADRRAARPNPTKLPLWGDTYRDLVHLRVTLGYYRRFRQGMAQIPAAPNRVAVERAMDECAEVGVLKFMETYGFSWANVEYYAMRKGVAYPSKAMYAVAHQYMPSGIPLDKKSCNGNRAREHLERLGIEISKRKAIVLYGRDGQTYAPVTMTNSKTGVKAYRYKLSGASNRTDDAQETDDLSALARLLMVDKVPVRIAPIEGGPANYLTYPGKTFAGYWVRPDISADLGIAPEIMDRSLATAGMELMKSEPENIILHGPPGTGKTWRTAYEAVRLCDGSAPQNRDDLMTRYRVLEAEKRIAFVTFHQSMDYETFVEGLRPETEESESGGAGFRLEPRQGIFREICALADQARLSQGAQGDLGIGLDNRQFWKMSLGRAGAEDDIYDGAINGNYIVLGWGGDIDWSNPRFENPTEMEREWKARGGEDSRPSNYTQTWKFRTEMQKGDIVIVPYGNNAFRAIAEVMGDYQFVKGEYNHRREVRWLLKLAEPLPLDTIVDGKFTLRTLYRIQEKYLNKTALQRLLSRDELTPHGQPQQFVLIIDEINRANISKTLGELITLIEADKRLGERNAVEVTLPYSRKIFGVPNNLHIVGTMNTADRSVALLDIALRRRFRFVEMPPSPQVLAEAAESTGVPLVAVLTSVNDRIEYLLDRDHRIGHAFLLDCQSRKAVDHAFRDKVIPLLQEYFFEDWSKVAAVLGERTDPSESNYQGAFLGCRRLKDPTGQGGPDRLSWYVLEAFAADAYERLLKRARTETLFDGEAFEGA